MNLELVNNKFRKEILKTAVKSENKYFLIGYTDDYKNSPHQLQIIIEINISQHPHLADNLNLREDSTTEYSDIINYINHPHYKIIDNIIVKNLDTDEIVFFLNQPI